MWDLERALSLYFLEGNNRRDRNRAQSWTDVISSLGDCDRPNWETPTWFRFRPLSAMVILEWLGNDKTFSLHFFQPKRTVYGYNAAENAK